MSRGTGAPRSGDATVRESLAATGKEFVRGGNVSMVWHELAQWHAGGDRRVARAADNIACRVCSA